MAAVEVADEDLARLQPRVDRIGVGDAHQDEVRVARERFDAPEVAQGLEERVALGPDARGLLLQRAGVREHALGHELREDADVVRRAHLVELPDPLGRGDGITEPHAGEPQLRHGAHHHQVREFGETPHEGPAGEHVIRLVEHDEAGRGLDDPRDRVLGDQVAGRIVRVSDEGQRRTVGRNRVQEAAGIELEIAFQRHADVVHPGVQRVHLVHRERRFGREHHRAGPRERLREDRDDLVGAVADEQPGLGRDLERVAQPRLQLGRLGIRIAVDCERGDRAADLLAQRLGQAVRVLHRVELDHARRGRHMVGLEREDLLAHEVGRA